MNTATPLRVLHVGKYYPPYRGGMEAFLADLIEQQRAAGVDAHALVHGQPQADDPPWLTRVRVQITLVFAPIALGFPWALWRAIRRIKPDVIHLHMPNNAAFWALLVPGARRVPWVVHWHSDVLIGRWDRLLAACYQLYRPFQHKVLQAASAILATSPPYMAASQPLQPWLFKTIAIPLGLKHRMAPEPDATTPAQTPEWGAAQLRILSVGRLTYYKGFDTLVRAVAGQPDVKLLIAGEGEQRAELEQLIARERAGKGCANVELLGAVSEAKKHALFNSCDVFALASRERTEAFGLVLIEAMQHGKPCIVSDLEGSGMGWVVNQAQAGYSYAPDQVQAWREAIVQCLNTKAALARRGLAGQRAAAEQFTIEQCERGIRDVYLNVLQQAQAIPLQRYRPAAGRSLQVLIVVAATDWDLIAQHPNQRAAQRLVINASGAATPNATARSHGIATIDLEPPLFAMADALAVVRLLVVEQGIASLTIEPVVHRRAALASSSIQLGKRGFSLRPSGLHLDGSELKAWLRG